jgi:hypothetical protein
MGTARDDLRDLAAQIALQICQEFGVPIQYLQDYKSYSGWTGYSGFSGTFHASNSSSDETPSSELGMVSDDKTVTFSIPRQSAGTASFPPGSGPRPGDVILWGGATYVVRGVAADPLGANYKCTAVRKKAHYFGA